MADILCRLDPSLCNDPSVPTANFSSESPDSEQFYGRNYGVQQDPPLGSPWEASSCLGTCVSTVSQQDANECAQRANITCLSTKWPVYEPNPNPNQPNDPFIPVTRQTYLNDEQSAEFECPDGSVFTYTIPAGTVSAFSQAAADTSALSMAEKGATDFRICIGDLTENAACSNETFFSSSTVTAPSLNAPGFEMVATISDGVLPPGMQLDYTQGAFTISGDSNSPGQYDFTVQVDVLENGFVGNFMQKSFTIYVREVMPDTLAEGTEGNNYSDTLSFTGAIGTVTWGITSGALPDGLTLDTATGVISGVPGTEDVFTFTATGTDSVGSCSKELSIDVGPGVPFDEMLWTQFQFTQTGQASASFTPDGGTGNEFTANTSVTNPVIASQGRVVYDGDLTYAGPNRACRVTMQIVNVQPGIGSNSLVVTYFLNAVAQTQVTMPVGYNGELQLDFTAMAGDIKIRVSQISSQGAGDPSLSILTTGVVANL